MTRILIILLSCISTITIAQERQTIVHEYSILNEFVELKIIDNKTVELYIWPYYDYLFSGKCIQSGDTLSLELKARNDSLEESYSYPKEQSLLKIVSELLIIGDYFIPTKLANDTTKFIGSYAYSNGHIRYILTFNSDSTYKYRHGDCLTSGGTDGKWTKKEQEIILKPDTDKNVLHWLCTDYKFNLCKNYIVGERDDKGTKTIRYLMKIK